MPLICRGEGGGYFFFILSHIIIAVMEGGGGQIFVKRFLQKDSD